MSIITVLDFSIHSLNDSQDYYHCLNKYLYWKIIYQRIMYIEILNIFYYIDLIYYAFLVFYL